MSGEMQVFFNAASDWPLTRLVGFRYGGCICVKLDKDRCVQIDALEFFRATVGYESGNQVPLWIYLGIDLDRSEVKKNTFIRVTNEILKEVSSERYIINERILKYKVP